MTSSVGTGCFVELSLACHENMEVASNISLKTTPTVTLLARFKLLVLSGCMKSACATST